MVAPQVGADEPQQAGFPTGRIYTGITWQPPGQRSVTQIVAIDPETGAFESVAASGNDVRLSPDRRTIAFRNSFETTCDVLIRNVGEDENGRRIWTGDGSAGVCWTHDGKHVVVIQAIRADDRWKFTNWLVEPESAEASQLELPDTEGIVDCAHHTDLLISWSFRNKKRIELFTLRPDGSDATNLTSNGQYDYHGRFSPDDTRIAFMRRQGGQFSVCTADIDGKNPQIAFTEKGLTYPDHVAWSPDGKQLAAVLFDWALDAEGRKVFRDADANFRIAIMNPDGSDFRELKLNGDVIFMGGDLDWR
ncbi:MAG: hypothetical protein WD063_21775 [Pirellulales bacterium]